MHVFNIEEVVLKIDRDINHTCSLGSRELVIPPLWHRESVLLRHHSCDEAIGTIDGWVRSVPAEASFLT